MPERTVYPTYNTVQEADDHLKAQLPVTSFNDLRALAIVYHNTLVRVSEKPTGATQNVSTYSQQF